MELHFASRMKDYEEGIFQVLNEKKNELERQGRKVYNLSVGTPDFKPQQRIIDAVVNAAGKPENYKYALRDLPELTDAVISRYQKRYGVQLEPEEIMSVYGSQEGIAHVAFPSAMKVILSSCRIRAIRFLPSGRLWRERSW